MHLDMIRRFRARAGHLACNSGLYNWSLGGAVPDRLLVLPPDTWPGNPERGRYLCSGAFAVDGETLAMDGNWEPQEASAAWLGHMHGFEWLRDLRTLGGDQARSQARAMIASWLRDYPVWHETTWRPDMLGLRLSNWIGLFPFYGQSADQGFQDLLLASLARQGRHLARALPGQMQGMAMLRAIRGLAYAGLVLEGREAWLEFALDLLERETGRQILADGGHVSRSPAQLAEALRVYIDIRNGLRAGQYPVPEQAEHTIDRMAQALRFFRGSDKKLALFNGAQEGDDYLLDCIMLQSNARGRSLRNLPQSGYERLTLGRTTLTVDTGTPPPHDYDSCAHAGPLAFEFSYGKEKIFTSCGTHPLDAEWRDMLRGTAAHNTLSLDYRNACEIRADGHFGRKARHVTVAREEAEGAMLLDLSHDGYVPMNGVLHRRRFFLSDQGHDLRGEENLTCSVGLAKPVDVILRFHLHPRVQVSLIRDNKEALLRLPGGAGWRFFHSGGALSLDNSIYLGEGCRPRKTKQLVVLGRMDSDHAAIKWALQREGG
jgi:uncharacterized heparinase superfamily protein